MIDQRALEDALRRWLVAAVAPEVPGPRVVFDQQDAPRPARPYATLSVGPLDQVGREDLGAVDARTGRRAVKVVEEFTATVNVFGPDALQLAQRAAESLGLHETLQQLRGAGVVSYRAPQVQDLTGLLDDMHWEPRAQFDARFAIASEATEDVGVIERVSQHSVVERPNATVAADVHRLVP